MSFTHAGQYSDDVIYKSQGAAANVTITIKNADGSAATLYTDATKVSALPGNTVTTDVDGNLTFFADPATYICEAPGGATFYAVVPVNPADATGGGGGGMSNPMTTLGDIIYENAGPSAARLAGDTSNTRKFLRTKASSGVAQAPAWDTIQAGDVPTLNQNTTGTASNITGTLDQVPAPAANVPLNSHKITGMANGSVSTDAAAYGQLAAYAPLAGAAFTGEVTAQTPTNPSDVATKSYVDGMAAGLSIKASAQESTVAALLANTYSNGSSGVGATLTANSNGALTVDGIAVTGGDRVLVQNESTASHNGVYAVTQAGDASHPYILTRATDMNTGSQFPGAFCFVEQGTANGGAGFVIASAGPFTVGTTSVNWTEFTRLPVPLPLADGGTGQSTQQAAMDALAGAVTSAQYLRGNGTHVAMSAIQSADVPTLNQSTTGTAANFTAGATLPKYIAPAVVSLTDASTVTVDVSLGNDFRLVTTSGVGASRTMGAPSNNVDGERISFHIQQAGSGGPYTVSWNTVYDFGTAGAPTLTTTASKWDVIGFIYNATLSKWCCVGSALGF